MRKTIITIFFITSCFFVSTPVLAVKNPPIQASDLLGRLVLQTDSEDKLWYVTPITKQRWYLHDNKDLETLIYYLNAKPTKEEFNKFAKSGKTKTPRDLLKKYGGRIITSPENDKIVFYLNPADGVIYKINNFDSFYKIASVIGKKTSGDILNQLTMNQIQFTYDPAFYGIASVKYNGNEFSNGQNSDLILPLASLTKLMTALVLLDTNPSWDKKITITKEEINYPCTLQLCGTTSEIDLRAGDIVTFQDLWIGMLSASSNQSSVILVDNSGLSREEFVEKMNEKASSTLGLVKTKFVEMSGLSADNISTAEEFAKIANMAFSRYKINEATRTTNYTFTAKQANGIPREVTIVNRNYSLMAISPNGGSKSGYLVEAQRNAVVEKDGQVAVALHCYSLTQRNNIIERLLNNDALVSAR